MVGKQGENLGFRPKIKNAKRAYGRQILTYYLESARNLWRDKFKGEFEWSVEVRFLTSLTFLLLHLPS